jgi:hypothetical protein
MAAWEEGFKRGAFKKFHPDVVFANNFAPFIPYAYIHLNQDPNRLLDPKAREFVR